jgi:tetratricopeptide (TPR) repeat protein
MTAARRSLVTTLWVALLLAGAVAVAAARWTGPIADADEALAAGHWDRALAGYARAEGRFDRMPVSRQILRRDYDRLVANQLWLYYRMQRYDELIARAERAPEGAAPHFWSGLALLAKGQADARPEGQLGWLTRSEEELRRAVEAAPADWDTKFDFELVTRLAAALRKQPKIPPGQLMQVLRPQPKIGTKPVRRVG